MNYFPPPDAKGDWATREEFQLSRTGYYRGFLMSTWWTPDGCSARVWRVNLTYDTPSPSSKSGFETEDEAIRWCEKVVEEATR